MSKLIKYMPQKIVYKYLCRSRTFIIEEYKGENISNQLREKAGYCFYNYICNSFHKSHKIFVIILDIVLHNHCKQRF